MSNNTVELYGFCHNTVARSSLSQVNFGIKNLFCWSKQSFSQFCCCKCHLSRIKIKWYSKTTCCTCIRKSLGNAPLFTKYANNTYVKNLLSRELFKSWNFVHLQQTPGCTYGNFFSKILGVGWIPRNWLIWREMTP